MSPWVRQQPCDTNLSGIYGRQLDKHGSWNGDIARKTRHVPCCGVHHITNGVSVCTERLERSIMILLAREAQIWIVRPWSSQSAVHHNPSVFGSCCPAVTCISRQQTHQMRSLCQGGDPICGSDQYILNIAFGMSWRRSFVSNSRTG